MTVTFEHVTKVYQGNKAAISDLNLEVKTGELMVFIGPSGCGKTTTLRMVNRLEEPTYGKIEIDGREIKSYNEHELRRSIGYTVQQTGLFPHMTIRDNIDLVPSLLGWPKDKREARIRELLNLVDMKYEDFAHRYPRQLSGGQQQRIGVLRSLAADPPIILMDEPFGALDPISRETLQTELKRLQERLQKTIIFVTHDMDEALRLGDRITVFETGRIVQVGTPEDIVHRPQNEFVSSFVGRRIGFGQTRKTAVDVAERELKLYKETAQGHLYMAPYVDQFYLVDSSMTYLGSVRKESVSDGGALEVTKSAAFGYSVPAKEVVPILMEVNEIPVLDESNRLVGVITKTSVLKVAQELFGGGVA
ncbi:betaine/proline/choline family ABC transporter ATP-binding protein [Fodinisporobacter ferrooxydans]|uniref:Quaternary amine transport ATP-binding protein n=1 Tax=Fodinisporobacter ferrooxydans TaxID=2901836 RepID=A0ABY4CHZ4_9BACL|nr:betaine/proline/choline family ABC transporter ATP-binding protein [Alicyclobacillaceae bacterium MYW30-H2]